MSAFSSVSRLYVESTRHPEVVHFCEQTGHKVILVRASRGWLLRIGSRGWTSPNFGAVSEIASYCRGFNTGWIGRCL